MFFRLVSLAMAAVATAFAWSVDSDHALSAVMIPAAAAFGIAMLAGD